MSSLFPGFSNLFSVGKTISQSSNTDPNDVLNTKNALAQTGDYQMPGYGITDIPDMGMIDGLKRFQQKNGLKVDGIMKPGGPTESKIGETLANQGISTLNPLATKVANPKPKPTKIDPLTGLPEVKMQKLKKPTNAMWEEAANSQKPKTSPWFKSDKLQAVSNEAHAENTRTMDGMLNYSNNGFLPTLYADAVKNGGDQAIAEYANFLNQLSNRKKERVDSFEQEVMNKLPDNQKQVLLALAEGGQKTGGDTVVYQTSDGQAKSQATDQEKSEQGQAQKKDIAECEVLKPKYQAAKREYDFLSNEYAKLSDEYFKLGPKRDSLKSEIQSDISALGLGVATGRLLGWLASGFFKKLFNYLSNEGGKAGVQSVADKVSELARTQDRINEIQPQLDPLWTKKDDAFQKFSRLQDKADAIPCQYHDW